MSTLYDKHNFSCHHPLFFFQHLRNIQRFRHPRPLSTFSVSRSIYQSPSLSFNSSSNLSFSSQSNLHPTESPWCKFAYFVFSQQSIAVATAAVIMTSGLRAMRVASVLPVMIYYLLAHNSMWTSCRESGPRAASQRGAAAIPSLWQQVDLVPRELPPRHQLIFVLLVGLIWSRSVLG